MPVGHHGGQPYEVRTVDCGEAIAKIVRVDSVTIVRSRNFSVGFRLLNRGFQELPSPIPVSVHGRSIGSRSLLLGAFKAVDERYGDSSLSQQGGKKKRSERHGPEVESSEVSYPGIYKENMRRLWHSPSREWSLFTLGRSKTYCFGPPISYIVSSSGGQTGSVEPVEDDGVPELRSPRRRGRNH